MMHPRPTDTDSGLEVRMGGDDGGSLAAEEGDDASVASDADSGYWGAEQSTRSVTASIFEYEELHGRRFHGYHAGKYQMPNDELEQERIDIKYHAVRLAMGNRLFCAPATQAQAVLDVGTGTGIWAMDVADALPHAAVLGTDLSPIQPHYVPPNLHFEIADADEDWAMPARFDLVHCRIMNDFTLRSWPHFFEQAFAALRPGGWVECQEFDYNRRSDDGSIAPASRLSFWEREWTRGMEKIGLAGYCRPERVVEQMAAAGFVNVTRRDFKLPIGPWPRNPELKQAGMFGLVNLLEGLQGLSMKIFTELLGYSVEELEMLLMECRREIQHKSVHSYWPVYVIYAQKPDVLRSS